MIEIGLKHLTDSRIYGGQEPTYQVFISRRKRRSVSFGLNSTGFKDRWAQMITISVYVNGT